MNPQSEEIQKELKLAAARLEEMTEALTARKGKEFAEKASAMAGLISTIIQVSVMMQAKEMAILLGGQFAEVCTLLGVDQELTEAAQTLADEMLNTFHRVNQ